MNSRKAISPLIAGVMFIAIINIAIIIVTQTGMPAIEKMQDAAAIDQAKDMLSNLDKVIKEVAAEGKSSTRVVSLQIKKGALYVDNESDKIYYLIETEAEVISPRTKMTIGNLYFASNANVIVKDNGTHFIMENEHEKIAFHKLGNTTSFVSINASTVMDYMYLKDTGTYLPASLSVIVDNDPLQEAGNGYTMAEAIGTGLMRGRIIAHVNQSVSDYDIYFTLEGGADFLQVEVRNYVSHS
ncbi:MAG: hypothetical protein KAT91_02655 [Candidatus Aenigmarchaeota archaeon]|nr:hypothetical protein [Candidatus Aenigmarchaeota archaeon]